MVKKLTYEQLEEKVKKLELENLELKRNSINGFDASCTGNISAPVLKEIIDIDEVQSIMDNFYHLTNMVTAIVDLEGNVIESTGWQDICTRFHRVNPETCKNCIESDLYLSSELKPGEYLRYKCKNGLWDVATPLYVGEKHMGNIYTGQFFYDEELVDEQIFIRQAEIYGFDKKEYMEAFYKIPRYSRETVNELMSFLVKFTAYISKSGFTNHQLKKEIHERKLSELALQKSEEQLRGVFEAATNVSFIITDADENDPKIKEFSPGAEKIFGFSKNEITGSPVSLLHIPEDVKNFPEIINGMRETKVGFSGEMELRRKTGEKFPAFLSAFPLFDKNGEMYALLGVSFDLSEQKKLETQLQQSLKMESIGRLAGGIAHDFNNMLTVILGNTDMIERELPDHDPLIDNVESIKNAAERSADLTRQLLAFARKQTIELKVINLNETIEGLLKMLIRLIGENISLEWVPGKDLWKIKADPSQISQMLTNLCVNGRDSIKKYGKITIKTENVNSDDIDFLRQAGVSNSEFIMISVTDNGCGMDKDTKENLFEPFFTTKGVGRGTGLGLATVYGIVSQNKGFINVSSEIGEGTAFKICFPRNFEKNEKKYREKIKDLTGNETILLVEDEKEILKVTTIMLERLGYKILPACGSEEAMRISESCLEEIDMIMTDVIMPEMSGRDLAKKFTSSNPSLKCLFMSGYTDDVIANYGIIDDDIEFIHKPFTKQELSEKLRNIFNKDGY
ncbi:MAG: PocR ligand-binding domain-containing protein [Desulfobacteraceae bacterium]|nr:PocR ligand-binding domain-containing protein [Desulfobacteraceae bacterium]